jgi:hypothetical protein
MQHTALVTLVWGYVQSKILLLDMLGYKDYSITPLTWLFSFGPTTFSFATKVIEPYLTERLSTQHKLHTLWHYSTPENYTVNDVNASAFELKRPIYCGLLVAGVPFIVGARNYPNKSGTMKYPCVGTTSVRLYTEDNVAKVMCPKCFAANVLLREEVDCISCGTSMETMYVAFP